jgi:hypothetical protein
MLKATDLNFLENVMKTQKRPASHAGKLLSKSAMSKPAKKVAGSKLALAKKHPKKK